MRALTTVPRSALTHAPGTTAVDAAAATTPGWRRVDVHRLVHLQTHIAAYCSVAELGALLLVTRSWHCAVRTFLRTSRVLALHGHAGTRAGLVQLLGHANEGVEELHLCVTVANDAARDEREWLMAFGEEDHRAPTFDVPLGTLARFRSLRVLVCHSSSVLRRGKPWTVLRDPWVRVPVALSLTNLWELAESAPLLTSLDATHVERDEAGAVTDVFGPDATPAVLRRLREHCPQLRSIATLSSPGCRARYHLFQLDRSMTPRSWGTDPELQETLRLSLVSGKVLGDWPSLEHAAVAISGGPRSSASSRATVFDMAHAQFGEPEDVAAFVSDETADSVLRACKVRVYARLSLARLGLMNPGAMAADRRYLRGALLQVGDAARAHNVAVSLVSVPCVHAAGEPCECKAALAPQRASRNALEPGEESGQLVTLDAQSGAPNAVLGGFSSQESQASQRSDPW